MKPRLPGLGPLLVTAILGLAPTAHATDSPAAPAVTPRQPVELFDGRSLTDWVFVAKDPAFNAASIWSVQGGVIHCEGKPNGYARTRVAYRNYALHFEWRFPAGAGNSGVFVHLNPPDKVWPVCLEVQLKSGDAGSVRANGGSQVRELDPKGRDPINVSRRVPDTEKPLGEWNSCDVVCRDDALRITINGVLQNEVTGASVSSGAIGLQAEGAPVEFRALVVRPLTNSPSAR